LARILLLAGLLVAVLSVPATVAFPATVAARGPMQTGFLDPFSFQTSQASVAFLHARVAGASVVRLQLVWSAVAPRTVPRGFRPTDPRDPGYRFDYLDRQVELAVQRGLTPLVYIESAPQWALATIGGVRRASPKAFGQFATAAARRYSGSFAGLPRVRYWQAWNEPNSGTTPQMQATAPAWYRALVTRFAAGVHSARADNAVVAGGLSPFGNAHFDAPLDFMRRLLCMSAGPKPRPTCKATTPFEIWATHPYTAGGPTHVPPNPDDVSISGLPAMKALLDAAVRAHHVVTRQPVRFWATEFSWDTNPPDPRGVPVALHARWVSEALYRMWSAGVSLCVWFKLRDAPRPLSVHQSGLYFRGASVSGDTPKPAIEAFRFPFVAFRHGGLVSVWGRTPKSKAGRVVVEQQRPGGWTTLAQVAANRYGIFAAGLATPNEGDLRARMVVGNEASLAFSLTVPPDQPFDVFGS
jgi:hypothetical protein